MSDEQSPPCEARGLIRRARSAALATALTVRRKSPQAGKRRRQQAQDWPYASMVTLACDGDASPLLLLSDLADHSRNLKTLERASLLIEAASGLPNPQTGPRVTIMGRIEKTDDPRHARRFLARHPGARMYAGFRDFNFYRMSVERVYFVGGFGRAVWFQGRKFLLDAKSSPDLERRDGDLGRVCIAAEGSGLDVERSVGAAPPMRRSPLAASRRWPSIISITRLLPNSGVSETPVIERFIRILSRLYFV
ncbi:MAG: hypothetical protein V3V55_08360, partial [Rhodospirillales bacterium]